MSENKRYSVVKLCVVKEPVASEWLGLIDELMLRVQSETPLCFMLVDSFLNPAISQAIAKFARVCLVKMSAEQIWLGPVINAFNAKEYLHALQTRLKHNNPTLALAESLFPDRALCIPYRTVNSLSAQLRKLIKSELHAQLSQSKMDLTIVNINTLKVQHHPLCLAVNKKQTFHQQIHSQITLANCPVNFNIDGGSRAIAPEQTVQNITPFVSPITGLITHIQALKASADNPVKIYSTAFFKKPAPQTDIKLANDSFVHTCMGKGVSHSQSQASALCEAIERYCAHYQGDEPLHLATKAQLDKRYYDFQQLVPYSESQYQNFTDQAHPDAQLKQAACRYNDQAVHWLPTWSLSENDHVYLPLTSCFANIPFDDQQFARWHSNGCAAGNTLEEAILQALFELIERDATAIWWYNRIERPEFDLRLIVPEHFALLNETLSPQHDFWVLDLTHDIGVPVMVAVGRNKNTQGFSFGFGCHLQKELAAQRALTELCQLIPIREQNDAPFDFNAVAVGAHLFPATHAQSQSTEYCSSGDIKLDIENIVKKLKALNLETLVLNYSREPLPIKTAKVFVPGLCHIWPQLDNVRLYQVAVSLGWLEKANCEQTINPQALYI
ncbi:MAG: thiazole/oxazole-forming peptide maturase SagD family component [Psychromonas sp.]